MDARCVESLFFTEHFTAHHPTPWSSCARRHASCVTPDSAMSRANEEEHRPSSPLRRAHVTRSERLNPEMAELHAGTGMMVLETDMPRRWAITILQLGHRRTVQRHLHTIAARLGLVRCPLADRSRGEAARRGQFVDGAR